MNLQQLDQFRLESLRHEILSIAYVARPDGVPIAAVVVALERYADLTATADEVRREASYLRQKGWLRLAGSKGLKITAAGIDQVEGNGVASAPESLSVEDLLVVLEIMKGVADSWLRHCEGGADAE